MRPVNIYMLTRMQKEHDQQRLERQMSGRASFLNIKSWEIEGLRSFTAHLIDAGVTLSALFFYYSFLIPKLGKEFDLLRISDDLVLNVELKSEPVPDADIQKQLLQNRHYLATLSRSIRSYTYISSNDRLLRLTNGNRLVEADFAELAEDILRQTECYTGDLEELFKEEHYLVSPLTDPDRFLRRDYFLTAQQRDIRTHILETIRDAFEEASSWETANETRPDAPHPVIPWQGFVGLPGTGKTLLLFDLALTLSEKSSVCILFLGAFPEELDYLNSRLKRIHFVHCGQDLRSVPELSAYGALLIDEAHFLTEEMAQHLKKEADRLSLPVILSYNNTEAVSKAERREEAEAAERIESMPGYIGYRLTNRIRMNIELSTFTHSLLHRPHSLQSYAFPSVSVSYAGDEQEAELLLRYYREEGYVYIHDNDLPSGREYTKVVMLINDRYYYDSEGFLREKSGNGRSSGRVFRLYTGLNRAKSALAIVILNNPEILNAALTLLQYD